MTNIRVDLDVEMARKKVSLKTLSSQVGISMTNLSLLKNGKVRGIRFATLAAICEVLECQPGDLLVFEADAVEKRG